jgi:glycosyltransferase involved in cell wall biosynthesis
VIVSRNRVIERYFSDDDVFFIEPGDVDGLAGAIDAIVNDPVASAQRAANAQAFFDQFGWPAVRATFLTMVDEVTHA